MSNPLLDEIRKVTALSADLSDDQVRTAYDEYFVKLDPMSCKVAINHARETYLGDIPHVTKDTARVVQMVRELSQAHEELVKAGR